MHVLRALEGPVLALLRIVAGFLFGCHGAQKVFGMFGGVDGRGMTPPLLSMFGAAGIIEITAGLLIAVGLLSRYAAFIASGEMAVAYFTAHQPRGALPIENGGELPALFSFVFLYLAARGPGPATLGAAVGRPDLA
jgi:putative oxidoreductase